MVPKQIQSIERLSSARQRILGYAPADNLNDLAVSDCEHACALIILSNCVGRLKASGQPHRIRLVLARPPVPKPVAGVGPQLLAAVLEKGRDPLAENAVFSVALHVAALNRAQVPVRGPERAGPYGSFAILRERQNILSRKLRVHRQRAPSPTRQA